MIKRVSGQTGSIMSWVAAVFLIFLLIGVFATAILSGVKTWRTEDKTQSFVSATAAGATSVNVTLSNDLFQADVAEVISITSTDGADAPAAVTYYEDSLILTIAGLNDDSSRTLTVNYYGETDDVVMRAIGGFIGVLIIGGCAFGVIYSAAKSGHHRGRR